MEFVGKHCDLISLNEVSICYRFEFFPGFYEKLMTVRKVRNMDNEQKLLWLTTIVCGSVFKCYGWK